MCPKVQFTVTFLTKQLENHVCRYACVRMLVVFIPNFFCPCPLQPLSKA